MIGTQPQTRLTEGVSSATRGKLCEGGAEERTTAGVEGCRNRMVGGPT
jgi:hypothetical protein